MENKFSIVAAVLMAATSLSAAQPTETIEMDNGTVYMGHTATLKMQGSTSQTIFLTDSAVLVIPIENIEREWSDILDLNNLASPEWKTWFSTNPKLVRDEWGGRKVISMHNYILKGNRNSQQGYLLEKSPTFYKFYIISQRRDTIFDTDIKSIKYATRNPLEINGIEDIVLTTDGTSYKGQICLWTPKYTGVFNDKGTIDLVLNKDIASKSISPLNPEFSLFEQIEYNDEVKYHDSISSKDASVKGVIKARNRRPSDNRKPYYTVIDENTGTEKEIPMTDVKAIHRQKNAKFEPMLDEYLDEGYLYIRGEKLTPAFYSNFKHNNSDGFALDYNEQPNIVTPESDGSIELQYSGNDINDAIYVLPIDNLTTKDSKGKPIYFFSYKEMVNNNIPNTSEFVTPKGNKKVRFSTGSGTFIIFTSSNQQSYLIKVP